MGITVKHVVVAAVIFAIVGFVYVIGFSEIDPVRSPRARALDARASVGRLIGNVRGGMASGQGRIARAAGDDLIVHYPDDPRSWLNRGYAYRFRSWDADRTIERDSWRQLLQIVEGWDPDLRGLEVYGNALYLRGWALRGLGRMEESRADFRELAIATEESTGVSLVMNGGDLSDSALVSGVGAGMAYNLACYWAVAGETERALMYWRVCIEGGYNLSTGGQWWRVDPDFEELWGDERFWEIARERAIEQGFDGDVEPGYGSGFGDLEP
jgi:hypothetical protein